MITFTTKEITDPGARVTVRASDERVALRRPGAYGLRYRAEIWSAPSLPTTVQLALVDTQAPEGDDLVGRALTETDEPIAIDGQLYRVRWGLHAGDPLTLEPIRTITQEQADAALAAVKAQYRHYLEAGYDGPQLLPPGHQFNPALGWMVMWEDGPYEWAYRAGVGGVDEELLTLAADEPALGKAVAVELATEPEPTGYPAGVFVEAWFSYAVWLSPAE